MSNKKKAEIETNETGAQRNIGFRHRVKQTAAGEARPSQIAILTPGKDKVKTFNLETETDEVDFVCGRYPTKWRDVVEGEDLSQFTKHHIRPVKKGSQQMKVPAEYEGLKSGDAVAAALGGSGGLFVLACARRGETVGANAFRITPGDLKDNREGDDKDGDAELMVRLLLTKPELFYAVRERDRDAILITERLRARTEAMKARIACGQRLRQQAIGEAFRQASEPDFEGLGDIELAYDQLMATDIVFVNLAKEEERRLRDLITAVEAMDVYAEILSPVEGVGAATAARIIAGIGDIRRFSPEVDQAKLAELRTALHAAEENARIAEWDPDDLINVNYEEGITADKAMAAYREAHAQNDRKRIAQLIRSNKVRLANTLREAGRTSEADTLELEAEYLNDALDLRTQIGELHRKAEQRAENRFLAFCGVHVEQVTTTDGVTIGRFPSRKTRGANYAHAAGPDGVYKIDAAFTGGRCPWQPEARQGFYLLADQWNKRADSEWGKKLREVKAKFRVTHPEPIKLGKRTFYTDGHIQRMAVWRTITLFAKWLYREWTKLEARAENEEARQQTA